MPSVRRGRLRWLRYLAWTLVGVLLVAVAGSYGFARRSLPQITGQLQLAGLSAPVTVYRDDWGVPHIEAQTMHDLLMAQGFVTAQDRLWEMDLTRRAASGRLSEVLGASQVGTDKFFRALGLRRSAEKSVDAYAPWAREALDAYVQGVNAYINQATQAHRLPVEFTLLGYKPEPWTAVDSLTIGKFMAYDLGGNWPAEVYRYQLRQKVGDTLAKQLLPTYPTDGITIMKSTAESDSAREVAELPPAGDPIDVSGLLAAAVVPDEFVGSNNWVVGGAMTKSGKPLLANDPHLGIRTPAIWY
ncbi:MAG TPA: penicillin acylase family protein, partial [Symbiobacteriaceae bacterium]|nr:penicillin acylase family protein [Symbiobacteriaceae bacterium]